MRKLFVYSLLAVLCLLAFSQPASAQTVTGTLSGRVLDQSGGVIPNVKVVIKNEETNFTREATTNEDGYFLASFLPLLWIT